MAEIGYGYGSEWHLLRYLGYHRQTLNDAIAGELGGASVEWLDFPFSGIRRPLGDDREWRGLEFLGAQHTALPAWRDFWPQTGSPMNWDAVARVTLPNGSAEWLLVEAKAHVGELDSACGAGPESLATIRAALTQTAQVLGVAGGALPPAWLDGYYQYANRLAVLHFLLREGLPARLLFINFCGEVWDGRTCPADVKAWEKEMEKVHTALGLDKNAPLLRRVHHLALPIQP